MTTIPCPETSTNSVASLRAAFKLLSQTGETAMTDFLALIRTRSLDRVSGDFLLYAHPHQEPPLVTRGGRPWRTWLVLGGRGAGKTRAGAEWVRAIALGRNQFASAPVGRIALVGE